MTMTLHTRWARSVSVLGLSALLLTGCAATADAGGEKGQSDGPVVGGTLTVSRIDPFQGWELDGQSQNGTIQISQSVLEPLIRQNSDGSGFMEGIATDWQFDETNTALTVTLNPDAKFSNGEPVTAADVAFSANVWATSPSLSSIYGVIESTTVIDDHNLVFNLSYPNSALPAFLSWSTAGVLPENWAGMTEEEFWQTPIGAGAFAVDSWSSTGEIKLVRNEHYYVDGQPYLDSILNTYSSDTNSISLQIKSGQLDIADNISPVTAASLDSDLVVDSTPHRGMVMLMNNNDPALTAEVRQAIGYAIDYSAVAEEALSGFAVAPSAFLPPNVPGASEPTNGYFDYDPDEAKKLLGSEAVSLELTYSTDPTDSLIAQVVADDLAAAGIDVTLNPQDVGSTRADMFGGDYQLILYPLNAISPDAADVASYFVSTGLYTGWQSDDANSAVVDYLAESDAAAKTAAMTEIEDLLIADPAFINLAVVPSMIAMQPSVHGVGLTPWGNYYYATVWKD